MPELITLPVMPTEIRMLLWAVVLGLVHVLATGAAVTAQFGQQYGAGPRDEDRKPTGIGGRLVRAYANYMQTFPFFAALALAAAALGRHNGLTVNGALLFFWARLIYVPLYAAGIPVIRSVVWVAALIGLILMLIGLT